MSPSAKKRNNFDAASGATTDDDVVRLSSAWWWALIALAVAGGIVFYLLTIPKTVPAAELPAHEPDLANGEYIFTAAGCAECHAKPLTKCKDTKTEDKLRLAGGRCLKTEFGVFHVPNISPDKETGIGTWTTLDFVNSMKRGVGPGGTHLYPAFPYASYQRMTYEDLIDLKAYLDTLPAVRNEVPPHQLTFPYNIRRAVGLWQLLFVDGKSFTPDPQKNDELNRGAYLVQGPGHCGECHTTRNFLGATIPSMAFAGARNPEGKGRIPNITPSHEGIGGWSEDEIVEFLTTGSTPEFDVVGGLMAPVQENLAKLTPQDRAAIAAYLKSLPPRADAVPKRKSGQGGDTEEDDDEAPDAEPDTGATTE
jgi:mono/diheme cytochrome c family protein